MDIINHYDHIVTLALNSLHNPYFDNLFWLISKTATWAVLYIGILYLIYKRYGIGAIYITAILALSILFADQISSSLLKPTVQRFRPSHDPEIGGIIHIVNNYRGGMYGFASSHAANTSAIATITSAFFKNHVYSITIFVWATIVAYSRIYLGVHFVGDIIAGALIGISVGIILYYLSQLLTSCVNNKYMPHPAGQITKRQSMLFSLLSGLNIAGLAIASTLNL